MKKGFILFSLIFIISFTVYGCQPNQSIQLENLDIEAIDQIDIDPGLYTIPYKIEDLNLYIKEYGIRVVIDAVNQLNQPVTVENNILEVVQGYTYTVKIQVYQADTLIKDKSIIVQASQVKLQTPTNLEIYSRIFLQFQSVANATSYEISINDQLYQSVSSIFDISFLYETQNEYLIKVKAKGQGFEDSEYSEAIEMSTRVELIEIVSVPTITKYVEGDMFDISGGEFQATYSDGSKAIINYLELTYQSTALTLLDQTIVLTHAISGLVISLPIEVVPLSSATWTVTFDVAGGIRVGGGALTQEGIEHNGSVFAPVLQRKGYLFDGFDKELDRITSNQTITAIWIDLSVPTAGLSFQSNYDYSSYYVDAYFGSSKTVIIPDTYQGKPVTTIGSLAFLNKQEIETIYIGSNLRSIFHDAFLGCTNLRAFHVSDHNKTLYTHDDVLYTDKMLLIYPIGKTSSFEILEGTTKIGRSAFDGATHLHEISIPDSVNSIGEYAFRNTAWLNSQEDGVVYAGKVAYIYKGNMNSQHHLTINPDTIGIADGAFANQSNLIGIGFSPVLKKIGSQAFYDTGLINVMIPKTVNYIGSQAFAWSTDLEEFMVFDTFYGISSDALNYTKWLDNQANGLIYLGTTAFVYKGEIDSDVIIKEGTVEIADNLFYRYNGNHTLVNIDLPDSIKRIGLNAFASCYGLTHVYIPRSVEQMEINAFVDASNQLTIYADFESEPNAWNKQWNPSLRPVIWTQSNPSSYLKEFQFELNATDIDPIPTITAPFLTHIEEPVREGYELIGWYDNVELMGDPISFPYVFYSKQDISTTLYAKWAVKTYEVQFVHQISQYSFQYISGGAVIQHIVHGEAIVDLPVFDWEDYTFLGWKQSYAQITKDLYLTPVLAKVTTTDVINPIDHVIISGHTVDSILEIDVGRGFQRYKFEEILLEHNTTIQARASKYGTDWTMLPSIEVTNITSQQPGPGEIRFLPNGSDHNFIQVNIFGGMARGNIDVSHHEYKIGEGDWVSFSEEVSLLIPNENLLIQTRTKNVANLYSVVIKAKFQVKKMDYTIFSSNVTSRYVQIEQRFIYDGYKMNIQLLEEGTEDQLEPYQSYYTNESYLGCGPKAVGILMQWYGSTYDVHQIDQYVETDTFTFADGIFTTPAQMQTGIERILEETIATRLPSGSFFQPEELFTVSRLSPNSTTTAMFDIEESLRLGNPVIILVNDGDHYMVNTSLSYKYTYTNGYENIYLGLSDNDGLTQKQWDEIDYFFENAWWAEAARFIGYSSYRDTLISTSIMQLWS